MGDCSVASSPSFWVGLGVCVRGGGTCGVGFFVGPDERGASLVDLRGPALDVVAIDVLHAAVQLRLDGVSLHLENPLHQIFDEIRNFEGRPPLLVS